MPNIMIDYDGTLSALPEALSAFVTIAEQSGYDCYVVTQRAPDSPVELPLEIATTPVIYTNNAAKIDYCLRERGLEFALYIDDKPASLFMSHETITRVDQTNKKNAVEVH